MIEAPREALLRVLDPNEHINELRRRLRRELRSAEAVLHINASDFQVGLRDALKVALDLLAECHRYEKRWYDQQAVLGVLGGMEQAYRERYLQEQTTKGPWFLGFSRIWRRVLAILERLQVVEESSQNENRSAEALR